MIRLHMKINGSSLTVKTNSLNEIRRLEDALVMGRQFIKIGNKNYNMAMIEHWWYEEYNESEDDEQKPRRPKSSTLRTGE